MNPKIHTLALKLLAQREHSQQELRQKLLAKKYLLQDIEPIINALTQKGLQSDQRFAENYIVSRSKKGDGPLRISLALQAKGIPEDIIAEQLELTDNAWLNAAQMVWRKRFKGKKAQDFSERAKQMRFLQYRGFTMEQIEWVMELD